MAAQPALRRIASAAVLLVGVLLSGAPAAAFAAQTSSAARVAAFPIGGASVAIDWRGDLSVEDAVRTLRFAPAAEFRNPGVARPAWPLIVWVRIPLEGAAPPYLEASSDVGTATLYYHQAGSEAFGSAEFGMRVPYRERSVPRLLPTVRIPPGAAGELYVRLAVDAENRILPLLKTVDRETMQREDDAAGELASIALVFIGVFLSLAAANLFVYFFIRERSYLTYTGWMIANAVFAATYLHYSAWKWLWPGLGLPELPVLAVCVTAEGWLLLFFARQFLQSSRYVPAIDRIVLWGCAALTVAMESLAFVFPSVHVGPLLNGRDLFLGGCVVFGVMVFGLGVATMLAGNKLARFFVVANLAVCVPGAIAASANFFSHSAQQSAPFLALMLGQGIEGWLLFGALAYRLRSIARDFMDEQQRRIDAQAAALAQARELLEQRRIASTDALTGIANRRAFDEALAREWDRCGRTKSPLSLLIADVDFFKGFNDTYGHVLGDDCLRRVAGAMNACATRPGDYCCRYGGEEFAMILADTDEGGAYAVAAEVCAKVRALNVPHRGSSLHFVTVSVGVATAFPEPATPPAITEAADANLYRAKTSGRNRVASSSSVDQFSPRAERVEAPPLRGIQ